MRDDTRTSAGEDGQDNEDKRLLVLEAEFASVLKVIAREGNTLSPVVRNAWDGKPLQVMTKNSPARATGAHVSIVGHITADELVRQLAATEAANGFLNRFLLVCVRRSKLLPEGGDIDQVDWEPLVHRLSRASEAGRSAGPAVVRRGGSPALVAGLPRSPNRGPDWSAPSSPAPRHTSCGLALLYALLDQAQQIELPHLEAALALWEYAAASARWVFGDSLGDPLADEIYRALLEEPDGLTRSQLRDLFSRNRRSKDIGQALDRLAAAGRVHAERLQHRGRPAELRRACPG